MGGVTPIAPRLCPDAPEPRGQGALISQSSPRPVPTDPPERRGEGPGDPGASLVFLYQKDPIDIHSSASPGPTWAGCTSTEARMGQGFHGRAPSSPTRACGKPSSVLPTPHPWTGKAGKEVRSLRWRGHGKGKAQPEAL